MKWVSSSHTLPVNRGTNCRSAVNAELRGCDPRRSIINVHTYAIRMLAQIRYFNVDHLQLT